VTRRELCSPGSGRTPVPLVRWRTARAAARWLRQRCSPSSRSPSGWPATRVGMSSGARGTSRELRRPGCWPPRSTSRAWSAAVWCAGGRWCSPRQRSRSAGASSRWRGRWACGPTSRWSTTSRGPTARLAGRRCHRRWRSRKNPTEPGSRTGRRGPRAGRGRPGVARHRRRQPVRPSHARHPLRRSSPAAAGP